MEAEILLDSQWKRYDYEGVALFVRGVLSDKNCTSNASEEFFSELISCAKSKGVIAREWLDKVHGNFALILRIEKKIFLISDYIRSYPLFYFKCGEKLIITDNIIKYALQKNKFTLDSVNVEAFIRSGFVFDNQTVFGGVNASQAGEITTLYAEATEIDRYFEYVPLPPFQDSLNKDLLENVLHNVFRRVINSKLDTRSWIVPLSGGHDSRIIASMLKKVGVKNVICFSYGYLGNEQSKISRQVAEELDYPWYFVEYTAEKWHELHQSGIILNYMEYAFNGISTPHLQDFLAVWELKRNNILKKGDVFLPGHALDFIAGSHLSSQVSLSGDIETSVNIVSKKHLVFWENMRDEKECARLIKRTAKKFKHSAGYFPEYFNWQERQTKFIANSVRTYEFFGFEWRLPYWDKEIVEFFLKIKNADKIGRSFLFAAEKAGLLSENLIAIPYAGSTNVPAVNAGWFKKMLPVALKSFLMRITKKESRASEGLDQIYTYEARSIKELIAPIEFYPEKIQHAFKGYMSRFPNQGNYHALTAAVTLKKVLADNSFKFAQK